MEYTLEDIEGATIINERGQVLKVYDGHYWVVRPSGKEKHIANVSIDQFNGNVETGFFKKVILAGPKISEEYLWE